MHQQKQGDYEIIIFLINLIAFVGARDEVELPTGIKKVGPHKCGPRYLFHSTQTLSITVTLALLHH